MNITNKNTFS